MHTSLLDEMASGTSAVMFFSAKTYYDYDQIIDYCTFHRMYFHSDVRNKNVYVFTRIQALKLANYIVSAHIDAVPVNILKDW